MIMGQSLINDECVRYLTILCDQCDMVVDIPHIAKAHKANCPRCDRRLKYYDPYSNKLALVFGGCALFLFILGCRFYLVDIRIFGNVTNITVPYISSVLAADKYFSLSLIFVAFVLLFPALCLVCVLLLCTRVPLPKRIKVICLVIVNKLQSWCMPEIFLAGVLVSFVKLDNYGDVGINLSFFPFCLFIILEIQTLSYFNPVPFWDKIASPHLMKKPIEAGKTGQQQHLRLCRCCHGILPVELRICPRCYERGHLRIDKSIQWTLALLVTATILYIPANVYAVLKTLFVGGISDATILDGISYMWQDGDYPIAIIIFTASILIPVLKILALFWLCYFSTYARCESEQDCLRMSTIYNIVEFIGRWSMIDIFVVSVTSTLVRNGEIISVYPEIGAIFFATVVITTIFASKKYDPRLIWDTMKCSQEK